VVAYTERFPPDVEAAKFILTNREPELWSNKQTVEHNISDKLAERLESARLRMIERLRQRLPRHPSRPDHCRNLIRIVAKQPRQPHGEIARGPKL
jgi:hypothetical protein